METVVIYYSYQGHTKKIAEQEAALRSADLIEIKEAKKRSTLNAYLIGCPQALQRKKPALQNASLDLENYHTIIIAVPIWAGCPAPAFNSIVDLIPKDTDVELLLVSGGGDSSKSAGKTKELITARGAKVVKYLDIKASAK